MITLINPYVPPETPIRDVVDRCRVWESHSDPEIRRDTGGGGHQAEVYSRSGG